MGKRCGLSVASVAKEETLAKVKISFGHRLRCGCVLNVGVR